MKTVRVSIELQMTEEDLIAYAKAQQKGQATRRQILAAWTAAKVYIVARLRDFLDDYDERQREHRKAFIKQWPPHSLFCECRSCIKSIRSCHRHLKEELHWGRDGHVVN